MMARKCIEKYLETHKSTYIGRYRCHSAVQTKKFEHKFHYYILDIQFKAIDVFVTIDYSGDEIVPTFSVNLHEQEQEYIIKDALNKILYFNQFKTILHCHVFEHFIETHTVNTILEPLDYRNILDYLEYHSGTNQETVDEFYTFFNPYLDRLLYNKNYKKFMDSIALLLDKILYEYEWDGVNAKYLDTEYQFHLEYFKETEADFFCIQESKLQAGQIELELPEGYEAYWNYAEKKGYSGTAIFTKHKPLQVTYGIGIEEHDKEGRVITLEYDNFYLITCYTPNSQTELARLSYRMEWEDAFLAYVDGLKEKKPVIFCGDLNVAHKEIDLKNPKTNRKNAGFTDEEREKFSVILSHGYIDTFRYFYPEQEQIYFCMNLCIYKLVF